MFRLNKALASVLNIVIRYESIVAWKRGLLQRMLRACLGTVCVIIPRPSPVHCLCTIRTSVMLAIKMSVLCSRASGHAENSDTARDTVTDVNLASVDSLLGPPSWLTDLIGPIEPKNPLWLIRKTSGQGIVSQPNPQLLLLFYNSQFLLLPLLQWLTHLYHWKFLAITQLTARH